MLRPVTGVLFCLIWLMSAGNARAQQQQADVVIYGGTAAAITAAVQAKQMGKSVIVVSPDRHLGGLSSGGLGYTDSGKKEAVGGLSREFYHRVWKHYQQDSAWKWEPRKQLKSQGAEEVGDVQKQATWVFEPHVAEQIFEEFVKENQIPVIRDEWLNRESGVTMANGRIASIQTLSGKTYSGKIFIDATYEGDLMAAAGVDFHVGREANSVYQEKWNGVQKAARQHPHYFKAAIDPYRTPGDPASGLLPRISADPPGEDGTGDDRIQAYCYRMCLSRHPENRIPFPRPEGYDASQYELVLRLFDTGWRETFRKFDAIPNLKTDTNNHGPFSFDNIGYNYNYPTGSYEERQAILAEHTTYQQGLLYFLANDPRVPEEVRTEMNRWGLPKDEFTDNGGWSHQIYVREARRMIGKYVMTEHDCLDTVETPDSIGMGSYTIDSHNTQRYVTADGHVQNEGDVGVHTPRPYEIAYGAIVPQVGQCPNLLVPICCSSSHIAYGSIRMEPVFMILGQSAATAAAMAIDDNLAVQDVPYAKLSARLLDDGQVLQWKDPRQAAIQNLPGIVVDDEQAVYRGNWAQSSTIHPFIGVGYHHDDNQSKGENIATFETRLSPGRYDVRIAYVPNANRSKDVPVVIHHAQGTHQAVVDQRRKYAAGDFDVSLGVFEFKDSGTVTVSNAGTTGYVVLDAVRFVPVK